MSDLTRETERRLKGLSAKADASELADVLRDSLVGLRGPQGEKGEPGKDGTRRPSIVTGVNVCS